MADEEENVTDVEENAESVQPEEPVEPEVVPDEVPPEEPPKEDVDFKTLLDKSLEELQNAAEGLDDAGLSVLTEELEEQIGEMGKATKIQLLSSLQNYLH